eukprot:CAMPEP_0115342752 /NCGR_PEP_ID=MMETSP0270-20121206/92373_1 /TAXON_ID=71861 /ORGANISM="Scrippsiella trochoidea, Strain CCMP3099" /LENGTH=111 /DNA_ID=CAMNT_0002764345 /DNA_START=175 /DNA_END=506 /DNA_ORIENTATION=+
MIRITSLKSTTAASAFSGIFPPVMSLMFILACARPSRSWTRSPAVPRKGPSNRAIALVKASSACSSTSRAPGWAGFVSSAANALCTNSVSAAVGSSAPAAAAASCAGVTGA